MSSTGPGLPEHEQQAWDAIVADLRGEIDLGPEFASDPATLGPQTSAATAGPQTDPEAELDEGYVPPHPPPIPRPDDAIGRFSWAAVLGGPTLVLLVTLLNWDRWLANVGIVLAVAGFVSLVWRMNDRDDDDDGAVV